MLQLYRLEMQHLIDTLQGYVYTQVLHVSWAELKDKISQATSLAQVVRFHGEYLRKSVHRLFLGPRTRTVMAVIRPTLGHILQFRNEVLALDLSRTIAHDQWLRITNIVDQFWQYAAFLFTVLEKLAQRGFKARKFACSLLHIESQFFFLPTAQARHPAATGL